MPVTVSMTAGCELQPAIVALVEELAAGPRHVDRLQQVDVHRVLDLPGRIAGCQGKVGDRAVARVARIDLSEGAAGELLVGPDRVERRAAEGRRLDGREHDPGDARLGGAGGQEGDRQGHARGAAPDPVAHDSRPELRIADPAATAARRFESTPGNHWRKPAAAVGHPAAAGHRATAPGPRIGVESAPSHGPVLALLQQQRNCRVPYRARCESLVCPRTLASWRATHIADVLHRSDHIRHGPCLRMGRDGPPV